MGQPEAFWTWMATLTKEEQKRCKPTVLMDLLRRAHEAGAIHGHLAARTPPDPDQLPKPGYFVVADTASSPDDCDRTGCHKKAVESVSIFGIKGRPGYSANLCREHADEAAGRTDPTEDGEG